MKAFQPNNKQKPPKCKVLYITRAPFIHKLLDCTAPTKCEARNNPEIKTRMSRPMSKTNARQRNNSHDKWWNDTYIAHVKNGMITSMPTLDTHKVNRVHSTPPRAQNPNNSNPAAPFIQQKGPQPEPIVKLKAYNSEIHVYCDTGANCDVITTQLLNKIYPDWRSKRMPNRATLLAANNTPIKHIGTIEIPVQIPGLTTPITLNAYITEQNNGENVAILGYPSMIKYQLIPIPGYGLIRHQSPTPKRKWCDFQPPKEDWQDLNHQEPALRKISENPQPTKYIWKAHPTAATIVPAFHKAAILLKPDAPNHEINNKNGAKILIRRCPCVQELAGTQEATLAECETCINPDTSTIQIGYLCNGIIEYQYDNTKSNASFTIDPTDTFFITFEKIFNLKDLAQNALGTLHTLEFEVDVPSNQYSEEECANLFQTTKEKITNQLRAICAEPESWSLAGHRPATLKLINHKGEETRPEREMGPAIPFGEYKNLNPCINCTEYKEEQCNIERIDCKLRKYHRYNILRPNPTCKITETGTIFDPKKLNCSPPQAVIGCHRNANGHQRNWRTWFKYQHIKIHPFLIDLHDAPVTEVSKISLIATATKISKLNISTIHLTNYKAFGISKNLLTKCFPPNTTLILYNSEDIQFARPGSLSSKMRPNIQHKNFIQAPSAPIKRLEPGIPKTISALDAKPITLPPEQQKNSEAQILTDDPQIRKDCIAMLDAHNEVFATSENDCGTFINPKTKQPYYFKIRLKDKNPVIQKTRFVAPSRELAATALVSALIDNDIVQRQHSPYNSQSVFVQKKPKLLTKEEHLRRGGKIENFVAGQPDPLAPIALRHCCDFVELNTRIEDAATTVMSPKAIITKLAGQRSCATLDVSGAYHCMMISPEDRIITGHDSGCPKIPGRLTYKRSVMGLKSSSTWLNAALSKTLAPAIGYYLLFADDILVYGKDDKQVLERLTCVVDLLRKHGWKLKRNKMVCFTKKLNVLGQQVSLTDQTIAAPRAALDAVLERPRPSTKLELKSFLGCVNWFGSHLPSHGQYSATLNKICRKDNSFDWCEPQLIAYESLLDLFSHPQVHNAFPDYSKPFHIIADTSTWSTGFLLCQSNIKPHKTTPNQHPMEKSGSHAASDLEASNHQEKDDTTPNHRAENIKDIFEKSGSHAASDLKAFNHQDENDTTSNHQAENKKDIFENAIPGSIKVISYHTHVHDERTARLSPHERESHGLILALATFFDLIAGCDVTLHTDSKVSTLITAFSKSSSKISRWATLLNSFCWLKINWLSSRSKMLQLADWLSRPEAGHQEWKNKSISQEELKTIDLAASKLKRNIAMTIRHHEYLLNWVCNLKTEDLHQIKDNSIFIDADGKINYDTAYPTKTLNAPKMTIPNVANENPERQVSPHIPPLDIAANPGQAPNTQKQTQESEQTPEGGLQGESSPHEVPDITTEVIQVSRINKAKPTSVAYNRTQNQARERNDPIMPINILTYDQADTLGLLSPSTQNLDGPLLDPPDAEYPSPPASDIPGTFLKMCFDKSPHMKYNTLIESQKSDPLLSSLRTKCTKGPQNYGTATFFLHSNILLRQHTKEGKTTLQLCLPKTAGYNLALKAHIGSGRGGWNHPKGPLTHLGPKKLQNLLSQRFHFEGMKKACQQIHDECNICSETKDNPCKTRADAKRSVIKVNLPGMVWAIDELKLPPERGTKSPSVLVAVDLFSRFTTVIPIDAPATSEYIMQLLQWNIMMVHGRMKTIICDNNANLSGQAMQQATAALNIILRTTPIYSPRSNFCENANKYILKSLRIYHKNHQVPYSQWRHTIPIVVSAMNYAPFSGELGSKHGLSPATLFYGGARQELDPANNFDLPYLAHVYENHYDFVKHTTEAAWVNTQIVSEHRVREMNQRAERSNHPHNKFSSHKTFNTGDIVILDRHHVPGTLSKLRPRAQYKFVILYETESSVFCKPWTPAQIETWCSAQKYSKQNKDAIIPLPVIKLPKELIRKDKSLALWTSRNRAEDRSLLHTNQPDPSIEELQVETYPDSDWIDIFQIDPDTEDDPIPKVQEPPIVQEEPIETSSPNNDFDPSQELPIASAPPHQFAASSPPASHPLSTSSPLKKGILKQYTRARRSPRFKKKCTFNNMVVHSDGSSSMLKIQTIKHIRRYLYFPTTAKDTYNSLDLQVTGHFHKPPSASGDKITRILPEHVYNRTCMCNHCKLQISSCRQTPCQFCIKTND